jgi:hypothetical protein
MVRRLYGRYPLRSTRGWQYEIGALGDRVKQAAQASVGMEPGQGGRVQSDMLAVVGFVVAGLAVTVPWYQSNLPNADQQHTIIFGHQLLFGWLTLAGSALGIIANLVGDRMSKGASARLRHRLWVSLSVGAGALTMGGGILALNLPNWAASQVVGPSDTRWMIAYGALLAIACGVVATVRMLRQSEFMNWWMGLDTRSLAFFRVALALVVLYDLLNRLPFLEAHYTDFGVLPRDEHLDKFMGQWLWSFHLLSGRLYWAQLLFALNSLFAIQLLLGYRTRLATFLCWAFAVSLQGRTPMVLQAGDVLLRCLLLWAMFLPIGSRWSMDAALRSARDFSVFRRPDPDGVVPKRVLTVGGIAFMLQVFSVYWFTMALKTGAEWHHPWGTNLDQVLASLKPAIDAGWTHPRDAVYYALQLDHFSTDLAKWMLGFPEIMRWLTEATFWVELLGPALALCFTGRLRLLAVLMMIGLHTGFGMFLKVGMFVYISWCCWFPLIPSWFWDKLEAWLQSRRPGRLLVQYRSDERGAGPYKWLLLARTFLILPNARIEAFEAPGDDTPAWNVTDEAGRVHTGQAGVQALFSSSLILAPFGVFTRSWRWVMTRSVRIRTLAIATVVTAGAAGTVYLLDLNTATQDIYPHDLNKLICYLGGTFLLAVLVVPGLFFLVGERAHFRPLRWRSHVVAQVIVGLLAGYVFLWNVGSLKNAPFQMESDHKILAWTLRLDQRWNMFAPFPMKSDGWFIMNGVRRDGQIVRLWGDEQGPQQELSAAYRLGHVKAATESNASIRLDTAAKYSGPDDWQPGEEVVIYDTSRPANRERRTLVRREGTGDTFILNEALTQRVGSTTHMMPASLIGLMDSEVFAKPDTVSSMYPGQRWRKYTMNLWLQKYKRHRIQWGRWMCRNYNRDHSGEDTLETFHLMYMKELTTPDGTAPLKCIVLWRHWCTGGGRHVPTPAYESHCKAWNVDPNTAEPPEPTPNATTERRSRSTATSTTSSTSARGLSRSRSARPAPTRPAPATPAPATPAPARPAPGTPSQPTN